MVGRALCKLEDLRSRSRLRLRVFLNAYQPEAKRRADMQPGTPETEAKGLLKSIEHLPTIL